jgi:hypothetical protein
MNKQITLTDLYKFIKNEDGSYTIDSEEFARFQQNFDDYLHIRHAIKDNPFTKDQYDKLYVYSKWYNEL